MARKRIAYALSVAALVAGSGLFAPASLFAEGEVKTLESCEGLDGCVIVTNTEELSSAFTEHKAKVLVGASFDLTTDVRTGADMELYLNDYTITSDGWSIINVDGELTIYAGENGRIEETGGTYAPLYVYNNTVMKSGTLETAGQAVFVYYDTGLFTMDGGTISGGSSTAVTTMVGNGGKMVMNDGEINGDTWGVAVFKDAEFEMNGGIITANSDEGIGVAGNGSASGNNEGTNAKITLNAGTINSGDLGVYAPQINGQTFIGEGVSINAGKCGVEVRAGELSVEGATIEVDADAEYRFDPNGSGSTASGVGIAVAQHTTQQPITATVSDGVFTAPVAFAEGNPQINPDEAVEMVDLSITGGEFNATNGKPVVASEDVEEFITGGTYNKEPDDRYIREGYEAYPAKNMTLWNVLPITNGAGVDDSEDEGDSDAIAEELENVANDILGVLHDNYNDLEGEGGAEFTTGAGAKFYIDDLSHAKGVLEEGRTVVAALDSDEIDMSAFDEEEMAQVRSLLEDGMEPYGLMNYWIELGETDGHSGGWLGWVSEIPYPITLTYDVSGAPEVPEGATRTWSVIRLHGESCEEGPEAEGCEVDTLDATLDEETGMLSYENDKFSLFLIAYSDDNGEEETPGTDTETGGEAEEEAEAGSPETGTVTMAGASAMSAAVVTSVAMGLLASIVSFAYLIRRK